MGYMMEIWRQEARDIEPGNADQARDAAGELRAVSGGSIHHTDISVVAALVLDAAKMQDEGFHLGDPGTWPDEDGD